LHSNLRWRLTPAPQLLSALYDLSHQVLHHQAALLSNSEVLTLLRKLADCFVRSQKNISAEHQPAPQTPEAITRLVKALGPYDLTQGEKPQIVNLAPRNHIELYVVRHRFTVSLGLHHICKLEDRQNLCRHHCACQNIRRGPPRTLHSPLLPPLKLKRLQGTLSQVEDEVWEMDEYEGEEFEGRGGRRGR
ncbi:hypothetical protein FB45DRAFT_470295, partial [Roridomyces roridus]